MKRILFFFLLFSVGYGYAQNYPKYTTKRVKDTVFKQPEKIEDSKELKKEPTVSFKELYDIATDLNRSGRYEEAIAVYTEALALASPRWKYLIMQFRGLCYNRLKQYDQAINNFTDALENCEFPNDNAKGQLYCSRALSYGWRGMEGDLERKCADLKKAREYGALEGHSALDTGCD
ncbi:tetratricopeptide repeat protein [Flavobacterium beibuense]|uniref:Bardet-Biedl syndrome protein 4 n=1 Tax=Flavobacterium beibuense TaxID=657326 RepID=A0A444WF37_9FLAO|nr:tetratricopeptide repeat protein [Flavobacterium beibuense]RYJ44463.1 Bardet-Biedl syndrome protein 4 [Flavobacterium beibuense]